MLGRKEPNQPSNARADIWQLHADRTAALFRLAVGFMILVVATFLAVEGWRVTRDYRQTYATAHDSVRNLAKATSQHAEDAIRQVDVLTVALSEIVEGDGLQSIDVPRIHALLLRQAQIMPQLHGLFIYGPDGQWIVTNQYITPETANNADRDYFNYHRTHTDRSILISDVIKSRSTRELIIPISRRLNNPDGSFGGVVLGTIKVGYFIDYYGDFKIDDKGALVLALRSGKILARRPYVAPALDQSLAESEIFIKHLPQSNEGVAEVKAVVDGTRRLYAYKALSAYPLVVEAGLSYESFIGPWRTNLLKTGLAFLVLVVGIGGFGGVALKQLRARIEMENEIRRAHKAVSDMAFTDSLTGLGNRRRLDEALPLEISRAKRQGTSIALIMIDVDYFKRYNDRYGHAAGDDCLRQIASAIQKTLKRPSDLAVRYGGEEFTVVLPDTDAAGATCVAQTLIDAIRALKIEHIDHPQATVTASAGVTARFPATQDTTPAGMIKTADAFLYYAKKMGRNQCCSESCIRI